VRLNRSSLHTAAVAAVMLSFGVACGGNAAAPTPTPASTSVPAAVPAPSPQRPPLASPIASPSTVAPAATPTTASTEVAGETYEVQSGDTLLSIAQQFYGDGTQWRRIYDANKDTIGADPDKLKIGMKLTVPPKQS
jgi:5'-nucleotidase / UDP-sugar diphosphatase